MSETPFLDSYAHLLPPFTPGGTIPPRPLARYLPALRTNMTSAWVGEQRAGTAWVLDPFGSSPDLDLELARAGRQVLVCVNNPILQILLELAAISPSEEEINHSLALLATTSKGSMSLQKHIQSLYQTTCRSCGQTIQAEGYLWERGAALPSAVEYTCPFCWQSGNFPLAETDIQVLDSIHRAPLQRAWATERLAAPNDPLRGDAADIVDSHLPRPLYVIFSIVNRLETLPLSDRERLLLQGLMLPVLDDASPLQQIDRSEQRPLQLSVPLKFREKNLWHSWEEAASLWKSSAGHRVRFTVYPVLPEGPGICLFPGRVRELAAHNPPAPFEQVITAVPRPNQAFWALSSAWSAWLLGREAARGMSGVIGRRRYDWNWHTAALRTTWQAVGKLVNRDTPIHCLLSDLEPALLTAVFQAMNQAGFACSGLAIHRKDETAQLDWLRSPSSPGNTSKTANEIIQQVTVAYLIEKAEPADYLEMTTAGCLGLDQANAWPDLRQTQVNPQLWMRTAFSDPAIYSHFGPGEQTLESGKWGLHSFPSNHPCLTDQIEAFVLRVLSSGLPITFSELEAKVRAEIRPVFIPLEEYLLHLLQSYADEDLSESGGWTLRPNEYLSQRTSDVQTIRRMIERLGLRLEFSTQLRGDIVEWREENRPEPVYSFNIISHAQISRILMQEHSGNTIRVLVLPGSRSNLIAYKLKNNPYLNELKQKSWHMIKFRHISHLAENPMITTNSLQLWLDGDPPEYQPLQMDLF